MKIRVNLFLQNVVILIVDFILIYDIPELFQILNKIFDYNMKFYFEFHHHLNKPVNFSFYYIIIYISFRKKETLFFNW